jgi:hypothetical protein
VHVDDRRLFDRFLDMPPQFDLIRQERFQPLSKGSARTGIHHANYPFLRVHLVRTMKPRKGALILA